MALGLPVLNILCKVSPKASPDLRAFRSIARLRRPIRLTVHFVGVMRFLQLEWHNHERARNAWDIERAEMKAKIAKQEGEVRSAKKLNDQLNRHIRMLEQALVNERAKAKAAASGETPLATEETKASKGKTAIGPEITKNGMNPQLWRSFYSSSKS
jgi:uncharacterized protein YlxW (UPF0749 family)